MRNLSLLPIVGLTLVLGCGSDLEQVWSIERVRVLAIRTTPAELIIDAQSGLPQSTELDVEYLAVAPMSTTDASLPISVDLALCSLQNPYTAEYQCPGPDGQPISQNKIRGDQLLTLLEQTQSQSPTASDPLDGQSLDAALARGVPVNIGYVARLDAPQLTEDRRIERGLGQFTVRRGTGPNNHPVIDSIQVVPDEDASDQTPVRVLQAGKSYRLQGIMAAQSFESYVDSGGTASVERMRLTWYVDGPAEVEGRRAITDSPSDADASALSPLTVDADASAGTLRIYVVARDGRGGTAWASTTMQVE